MGVDIHKVIGKIPFKPKKGFVLPKHRYTGTYNPLHLQLDSKDRPPPGQEPYNAVDAIAMRHDICYRDNVNGKAECGRKMLAELNAFTPVNRQLVRSKEVEMAFQELFICPNASPSRLWTDKGTEFYKQQVKRVLTANNVGLYSTENEENPSVWNDGIER